MTMTIYQTVGTIGSAIAFAMVAYQIIRRGMSIERFLWTFFATAVFLWARPQESVSNVGFGLWLLAVLALAIQWKRGRRTA